MNASDIMPLLRQSGFHFNKGLGQNFLFDEGILGKIADAAGVTPQTDVLEIGAGAGTLTRVLARRARRVLALELDRRLPPVIELVARAEGANVRVACCDALKDDIERINDGYLDMPFDIVANLPYYITTPLLLRYVGAARLVRRMTVLMQREVAERICASPSTKAYGALTLAVGYHMSARAVLEIPAGAFTPAPKVSSTLVRLDRHERPPVEVTDEALFFRVTRAAFAMRRKTMLNNICAAFGMSRQQASALLTACGADPSARGETLSMQTLAHISNMLADINSASK